MSKKSLYDGPRKLKNPPTPKCKLLAFFDIGVVSGINALLKEHGLKLRYRGSDYGDQVWTWVEPVAEKKKKKK